MLSGNLVSNAHRTVIFTVFIFLIKSMQHTKANKKDEYSILETKLLPLI